MDKDNLNISSIETHLDKVIRANISLHCSATTLPATLTEGIDDYVVIDCGNAINDLHAYGKGIVNLYLYAQPVNGMKNVPALAKMEEAFNKVMKSGGFDSENYIVADEVAYSNSGYDSTYNLHYIIKAIRLIIL